MNTDITMKLNILQEAIGQIDFDLIEESETAPEKAARVTAFAKPWMKWAVAAVLIIVIGVGTPVALRMMGAFRNENYVAPNGGSDNSGVITPIDSSEPDSSSKPSEDASSSEDEKPAHSGEQQSGSSAETPDVSSSGTPSGSSTETPDVSSGEPSGDLPEQPEGNFVKENMPAVTYKINGEYKTFDYQSSTAVVDSGSSYIIDHYVGSDGSTVSANAASGELVQYKTSAFNNDWSIDKQITEIIAIETTKRIVADTDITISGFDTSEVSIMFSEGKYHIRLSAIDGSVEVCLYRTGELIYFTVNKH